MSSLSPEEKVNFLLSVMKNTQDGKVDLNAVMVDNGINNRSTCRYRFKQIVEGGTPYLLNDQTRVVLKDEKVNATPATPSASKKKKGGVVGKEKEKTTPEPDDVKLPDTPTSASKDVHEDALTTEQDDTKNIQAPPSTPTSATPRKRGRPKKVDAGPKSPKRVRKNAKAETAEAEGEHDSKDNEVGDGEVKEKAGGEK